MSSAKSAYPRFEHDSEQRLVESRNDGDNIRTFRTHRERPNHNNDWY